jgi:8-oxo-dGTP pyrophosphatase MutT (NUDIX family)
VSNSNFERIAEREVHRGYIWKVVVAEYRSPEGEHFHRDIVRSPGAVSVVPVLERADGYHVVLVRQWRPSIEQVMIEVPAGMRDVAGEPPEETARRELIEEAGYVAGNLELLTMYHPSAGMTDGTHHVYLATELTPTPRDLQGPEEAHMTVDSMPLDDALAMISSGEITASNTVIGLLLADRRLRGGR